MTQISILLRGGTVLIHDTDDHVRGIEADLLIEGNTITKIETGIQAPSKDTQIIDCTNKIVSPGFVDTHHHVWQTLLKGRHANHLLLEYMYTGNWASSVHGPSDIFWGQLGGCLECLDVGTTTVVDHAHLNYSPAHSKAAIAATISSGIRSIFCYTPTSRVGSWKPFTLNQELLADWVLDTLDELSKASPFADGRVQLGFGFDGFFLPKDIVVSLFEKVKALGIKVITTHAVVGALFGTSSIPKTMDSFGLLDTPVIFSHASNSDKADAEIIRKTKSYVSTTPSTELQMAHGTPMVFNEDLNIQSNSSLGADCHSNNSASIVTEMRLLLQSSRGMHNAKFTEQGKFPKKVFKTVEEVFNLGTIAGARTVGMEDQIGSLAVGKLADVVVFDALSPSMVCAAQHDPVAAVVLHSHPSDIQTVIVDGQVRKAEGALKSVDIAAGKEVWAEHGVEKDVVEWKDIARELVKKRGKMQEVIEGLDMQAAKKTLIEAFYIDEKKIVDSV